MVAGAAWLTVAIGAAIALHQARAGTTVVALTAVSVVFSMHMAPAAIGLLALTGSRRAPRAATSSFAGSYRPHRSADRTVRATTLDDSPQLQAPTLTPGS